MVQHGSVSEEYVVSESGISAREENQVTRSPVTKSYLAGMLSKDCCLFICGSWAPVNAGTDC